MARKRKYLTMELPNMPQNDILKVISSIEYLVESNLFSQSLITTLNYKKCIFMRALHLKMQAMELNHSRSNNTCIANTSSPRLWMRLIRVLKRLLAR